MREKMPRRRRTGPSGIAAMKRGEIWQCGCVLALHTTSTEEISGKAHFTRLAVVGRKRHSR